MTVRPERPGDAAAIRRVNEAAFGRAAEADLVDALRAHGRVSRSLVAERAGMIVGHILFSPVRIDSGRTSTAAIGLAPMAVLPAHQRAGIGSLLVRTGLAECRRAGHGCVVVLGHPSTIRGSASSARAAMGWPGSIPRRTRPSWSCRFARMRSPPGAAWSATRPSSGRSSRRTLRAR